VLPFQFKEFAAPHPSEKGHMVLLT
jgi:hypothetical protein